MTERTHLSDEAVAAFADGVLSGHARERASRHLLACPECAHAVAVQREAVWALRAAPAPSLPTHLVDRLRSVPTTTPLGGIPAAMSSDGSAMFAAFGSLGSAALVPPQSGRRDRRGHADHAGHADPADDQRHLHGDGTRRLPFGLSRLFGR